MPKIRTTKIVEKHRYQNKKKRKRERKNNRLPINILKDSTTKLNVIITWTDTLVSKLNIRTEKCKPNLIQRNHTVHEKMDNVDGKIVNKIEIYSWI